jgi:hypothetical protein
MDIGPNPGLAITGTEAIGTTEPADITGIAGAGVVTKTPISAILVRAIKRSTDHIG